jgi:hypothetical protein
MGRFSCRERTLDRWGRPYVGAPPCHLTFVICHRLANGETPDKCQMTYVK